MTRFVLALLAGCRSSPEPAPELVFDDLGLPECGASYDDVSVCTALRPWRSEYPDEFEGERWTNLAVRWIGAEVDPYYCTEDAGEAEAFALAHDPGPDGGSHRLDTADERWFDVLRYDADGVSLERQRVLRCSFLADLGPAPPGTESLPGYATYGTLPVEDEDDFYPVFRELVRWRTTTLPVQVVLSFGEARTEDLHLRVCTVRCGTCEDSGGGRYRNVTGVLEALDVTLDPTTGVVDYAAEALLETDCYASW